MTGLVCAWCDQPSAGFASLPEPFLVGLDAGTRWPSCGAEGHGVDYLSREERHRVMQAEHAEHAEARAAGLPLDEIIRLAAGGFRLEESEVERLGAEVERLRGIVAHVRRLAYSEVTESWILVDGRDIREALGEQR